MKANFSVIVVCAPGDAPKQDRQGDDGDEQRADHDLHDDAGHVEQSKAEGDEAHQKRREDDAENAAGAAEDARRRRARPW